MFLCFLVLHLFSFFFSFFPHTKTKIQIHYTVKPFRSGYDRTVHRWIDPSGPSATGSHFKMQCLHIDNFFQERNSKQYFVPMHTYKLQTNLRERSADNVAVNLRTPSSKTQICCLSLLVQMKSGKHCLLFTLPSFLMLLLRNRQTLTWLTSQCFYSHFSPSCRQALIQDNWAVQHILLKHC